MVVVAQNEEAYILVDSLYLIWFIFVIASVQYSFFSLTFRSLIFDLVLYGDYKGNNILFEVSYDPIGCGSMSKAAQYAKAIDTLIKFIDVKRNRSRILVNSKSINGDKHHCSLWTWTISIIPARLAINKALTIPAFSRWLCSVSAHSPHVVL